VAQAFQFDPNRWEPVEEEFKFDPDRYEPVEETSAGLNEPTYMPLSSQSRATAPQPPEYAPGEAGFVSPETFAKERQPAPITFGQEHPVVSAGVLPAEPYRPANTDWEPTNTDIQLERIKNTFKRQMLLNAADNYNMVKAVAHLTGRKDLEQNIGKNIDTLNKNAADLNFTPDTELEGISKIVLESATALLNPKLLLMRHPVAFGAAEALSATGALSKPDQNLSPMQIVQAAERGAIGGIVSKAFVMPGVPLTTRASVLGIMGAIEAGPQGALTNAMFAVLAGKSPYKNKATDNWVKTQLTAGGIPIKDIPTYAAPIDDTLTHLKLTGNVAQIDRFNTSTEDANAKLPKSRQVLLNQLQIMAQQKWDAAEKLSATTRWAENAEARSDIGGEKLRARLEQEQRTTHDIIPPEEPNIPYGYEELTTEPISGEPDFSAPAPRESLVLNRQGQPYGSPRAAQQAMQAKGLENTHDIVAHEGGYVLSPRGTAPVPTPKIPATINIPMWKDGDIQSKSVSELVKNKDEIIAKRPDITPAALNDLIISKEAQKLETGKFEPPTPEYEPKRGIEAVGEAWLGKPKVPTAEPIVKEGLDKSVELAPAEPAVPPQPTPEVTPQVTPEVVQPVDMIPVRAKGELPTLAETNSEAVKPAGGKPTTLNMGLGGAQDYIDRATDAIYKKYNKLDIPLARKLYLIARDAAHGIQVRPERILRDYAPKAGGIANAEYTKLSAAQRRMRGKWESDFHKAYVKLSSKDRKWVDENFMEAYETVGNDPKYYPTAAIKNYADTWIKITDSGWEKADKLGVQETVHVDKWQVFKGENEQVTRVFPSEGDARRYVNEQKEPDLYTVVNSGEKMDIRRPISKQENYIPHVLTQEAIQALRIKNRTFEVLEEECKVRGIDVNALAEEHMPMDRTRRYGSFEYARQADLPYSIMVDGKKVPILETNPTLIMERHIRRASDRLAFIERYGQDGATKIFDDLYRDILYESGDPTVANQWLWMWQKLQGTYKDAWLENMRDYPNAMGAIGAGENYARAAQLSMATPLNAITGPVPIATRYGAARTINSMAKTAAVSIEKRLHVDMPFLRDTVKNIEKQQEMGVSSEAALRVTAETADVHSGVANTLLRAEGMNAINVYLNKVAGLTSEKALMDSLEIMRSNKSEGILRGLWGIDKKGITNFLKEEGRYTDADIQRMVKDGPTYDDISQLAQRSSTITNMFEEGANTMPASMASGWWRRLFAYTSWARLKGATVADAVRYARQGNVRPLVTLLVGDIATGYVQYELMNYLKNRDDRDVSFGEKLFDVAVSAGLGGVYGAVALDIMWSYRGQGSPLGMPTISWMWDLTMGMGKALITAVEKSPTEGAKQAYFTILRNFPALKAVDNLLDGPYTHERREKLGLPGMWGKPAAKGIEHKTLERGGSMERGSVERGSVERGTVE